MPWLLDQQTGALISPSAFDPGFWSDAASDPLRSSNVIWGVTGNSTQNLLMAVDPARGQLLRTVNLNATTNLQAINGIAIDPLTGNFFGASSTSLYRIDPSNGAKTLIGATTSRIDETLGFDASGVLYAVTPANELVIVDTSTAAITSVATLDVNFVEDLCARPEGGVMYAPAYTSEGYQLVTVDTASGAVGLVGSSFSRPTYLAFTGVPEPCALVLLLAALAIAGQFARCRRG